MSSRHPNVQRGLSIVAAVAAVAAAPSAAHAFAIYNYTGEEVYARVPQGDFEGAIAPNDWEACPYSDTDCNPSGAQGTMLSVEIQTEHFNCVIPMPAGGVALISAQDRSSLGLPPAYYCDSYDWNDHHVSGSMEGQSMSLDPGDRNVRFLVTADPQYHNTTSENGTANAVLATMLGMIGADRSLRGLVVAGDLTQNTRPYDEFAYYKGAIRGSSRHVFDGLGNHDLTAPNLAQSLACLAENSTCVDPSYLRADIRNRKRSTSPTRVGDPHYSWDWQDVHFVQLNLFPGDGTTSDQQDPSLDPMSALTFLRDDLATYVGRSGRPVVLIHHFGFDGFSTGTDSSHQVWWTAAQRAAYWDAISAYNVAAIFTGHLHLEAGSSGWFVPWNRPVGRALGPDVIPTFVSGGAETGAFVEVSMTEQQITVNRRDQHGAAQSHVVVPVRRNVALGKPATQSTVAVGGVAGRAVDGSIDGAFWNGSVTHTEWERSPWWRVDLQAPTYVDEVVVYNRTDCCTERLSNFTVSTSLDGATWSSSPYAGTAPARLSIPVNRRARYVRVQLADLGVTRVLSLTEVQVISSSTTIGVKHSGMSLSISGASTADGAELVQSPALAADDQRFDLVPAGGGYVTLVARHSGKCVDVLDGSSADGAAVAQWTCNGGDNQRFRVIDAGGGWVALQAKHSAKCLDVGGASVASGAQVIQWPCASAGNQSFMLNALY